MLYRAFFKRSSAGSETAEQLHKGPRIVAVGGGTGLSAILRGLKKITANCCAIVTVTDDGGSSGRLIGERDDALPPGDIRNCLVALSPREGTMESLFNYRFESPSELCGHCLGNLLLSGLADLEGDMAKAVRQISGLLNIRGRVLPVTLDRVRLGAIVDDGAVVMGETKIVGDCRAIGEVFLDPPDVCVNAEVLSAIAEADVILLGPGSLYSSIIPNLLVPGVIAALRQSRAPVYYVANIMTQPGETDGYSLSDHIAAITRLSPEPFLNGVIFNSQPVSAAMIEKYRAENSVPVENDLRAARRHRLQIISVPLLKETAFVQHDGDALARYLQNRC